MDVSATGFDIVLKHHPTIFAPQRSEILSHELSADFVSSTADAVLMLPLLASLRGGAEASLEKVPTVSRTISKDEESTRTRQKGQACLVAVSLLYGSLNVLLRRLFSMPNGPTDASVVAFGRGWLTAACFIPISIFRRCKTNLVHQPSPPLIHLWVVALELALLNCGSQGLSSLGLLLSGSSVRTSFLMQMSVVLTPLFSILAGDSLDPYMWAGCTLALAGLVVLSSSFSPFKLDAATHDISVDGGGGIIDAFSYFLFSFGRADLIVLGGAACWSLYLFRLAHVAERYPYISLQAACSFCRAVLYSVWFFLSVCNTYEKGSGWDATFRALWPGFRSWDGWALLALASIGPGVLASVLQHYGQRYISASESSLILCAEPVFTTVLAWAVLDEGASSREKVGGILIVFANLLASGALPRSRTKK